MALSNATGNAPPPPYAWVDSAAAFAEVLLSLERAPRIAVDIEADSLYHYFEKVCLIQMSTDHATFVLDPLALKDLSALGPFMADAGVEKVFHAAGYDIHSLRRDHGFSFANIFDTHVAAHLLGYSELGLGALLEKLLGVAHSKRRQRDDWSRRPLEAAQLEYAAMDTHHLLALRDLLGQELRRKGRLDWAREEFQLVAATEYPAREFDLEGFRSIKGSRNLPLQKLAVLRALYLLRERFAREMDLPPFKVMNNSVLLELARRPPDSPRSLSRRPGVSTRVARSLGREICNTIQTSLSLDPSFLLQPARAQWEAPSREAQARLERLKAWRRRKAQELGLHVGVVFPGSLLEALALSPPADLEAFERLPGMRRWRAREFGSEILRVLQ